MIFGLFRKTPSDRERNADALYAAIVEAARRPAFYRALGAPDTLPGRFELVVLHVSLAVRRLGRDPDPAARALSQELFDAMVRGLEANLREIGVGDMTVPKRMKTMARSFYDGAKAYDAALDARDTAALAAALSRIVYAGEPKDEAGPRALADWTVRADAALSAQPVSELEAARPHYPDVNREAA